MSQSTSMLEMIDHAPLTPRYWSIAAAVMIGSMLEFFDFFLIGFVVSIVSKPWHLTFGEGAVILLSAGIGAIVGSFLLGWMGDRWGRKPILIFGILLFSVGTGLMLLTPNRDWLLLSILRLLVGAGVGGLASVSVPLLIEFTPTRHRTYLGSFSVLLVPIGILIASALAASVAPVIGWRGLFAIGLTPALLAIWVALGVPESPRWLISKGRVDDARRAVAWVLQVSENTVPRDVPVMSVHKPASYKELLRYPKSFWATVLGWFGATTAVYGITLWGPTILTLQLGITPARAAFLFIFVSLGGFAGRIIFSFLPLWVGRRGAAMVGGAGAAILLFIAGLVHSVVLGSVSLFWLVLIAADIFADGSFANLAPYSPEIFPARLRSHGMGLAEGVNGIGKIIGPLGLAIIAGSSNFVSPAATVDAITPAFTYLAMFCLLVFVAFLVIHIEPQGRVLESIEADLETEAGTVEATPNIVQ